MSATHRAVVRVDRDVDGPDDVEAKAGPPLPEIPPPEAVTVSQGSRV